MHKFIYLSYFQAPSLSGKDDEVTDEQIAELFNWDSPGFGQGFTQEQVDGKQILIILCFQFFVPVMCNIAIYCLRNE